VKRSFGTGLVCLSLLGVLAASASGQGVPDPSGPTTPATTVPTSIQRPAPARAAAPRAGATSRIASVVSGQTGSVWAWGSAAGGKLGDGTITGIRSVPVLVTPPPEPVKQVIAGQFDSTLIVGASGRLWAAGVLTGTGVSSSDFVDTGISGVQSAAVGYYHAAAVDGDGVVHTWGDNGSGQLGDGTRVSSYLPVEAEVPLAKSVTTTFYSTAAVTIDGEVWTWGGALGSGGVSRILPGQVVRPAGMGTVNLVDGDYDHVEALTDNGEVWTLSGANDLPARIPFPAGTVITKISAAPFYAVGRDTIGRWWQWTPTGTPFLISNAGSATDIQAGYGYTLRLLPGGAVQGVGSNGGGQLGNGTLINSSTPVSVLDPDGTTSLIGAKAIAAGGGHSLAIKNYANVLGETIGTLGDGDCLTPQSFAPDPATVCLNATLRDFVDDGKPIPNGALAHPDFEKYSSKKDPGIVGPSVVTSKRPAVDPVTIPVVLGDDAKPIYAAATGGTPTTAGKTEFDAWWGKEAGTTARYGSPSIKKNLELSREDDGNGKTTYTFRTGKYFPIDTAGWGNQTRDHNYGFTTEIHAKFTFRGDETFFFEGDDDVFVYINGRLAVDMGGSHKKSGLKLDLTNTVIQQQLGITSNGTYTFDFFHAERHSPGSYFQIKTSLALRDTANPLSTESLYVSRANFPASEPYDPAARLNAVGIREGADFRAALNGKDPFADNLVLSLQFGAASIRCGNNANPKTWTRAIGTSGTCKAGSTAELVYTGRVEGSPSLWLTRPDIVAYSRAYADGLFRGLTGDGTGRTPHVEIAVTTLPSVRGFNFTCPSNRNLSFLDCYAQDIAGITGSLQSIETSNYRGVVGFRTGLDIETGSGFCPSTVANPITTCKAGWDRLLAAYRIAASGLSKPYVLSIPAITSTLNDQSSVIDRLNAVVGVGDATTLDILRWSTTNAYVAPQLYAASGANATFFAKLMNYWNDSASPGLPDNRLKLIVSAVTTTWQVCKQQAGCGAIDRAPRQSYADLHDALGEGGVQYLLGRTTSYRNMSRLDPSPAVGSFETGGERPGDPFRVQFYRRETVNASACVQRKTDGTEQCL
jgi:fibro-slime domain-containing protein